MKQTIKRHGRQYTTISNEAVRDDAVSIAARGLLALLLSYPDDWEFRVTHLQKVCAMGRDAFRRILKELETRGYVRRDVVRNSLAQITGIVWTISDQPILASNGEIFEDEMSRPPENPSFGKNAQKSENNTDLCNSAESLKTRPPENPSAGFSVTLRKNNLKKKNYKKPLTPKQADLSPDAGQVSQDAQTSEPPAQPPEPAVDPIDELADRWAEPVKRGRSYAAGSVSPQVAQRMLDRKLVTPEQLRGCGIRV